MKRLLFILLGVIAVSSCDVNIKARPNDSAGVIDSLIKKIQRIDTLYRVDTVIKETERLRVDTIVTSRLDTIIKVDTIIRQDTVISTIFKKFYDTTFVPVQVYKTDTLFKYDTVTKKDTLFQWWIRVDTVYKRDTLTIHDTITKSIRDTISAKYIILKDTLYLKIGDTATHLQFGDSLIIPIKVYNCPATNSILKNP